MVPALGAWNLTDAVESARHCRHPAISSIQTPALQDMGQNDYYRATRRWLIPIFTTHFLLSELGFVFGPLIKDAECGGQLSQKADSL